MTREDFNKKNIGIPTEENNTMCWDKLETPFLFISDKYYSMMVEKGETRSKEHVEVAWMLQHLTESKYDAKILVY